MTSFLQNALAGNPFSTPVGSKIDQATDGSLASENWALNMEICDYINENEDGAKDAIRAIRKKLNQNVGKNYTVIMYTLTVLETCVKNCGRKFHILVCNKEFVQELVKLLSPKNDPPTAVQEKVLSLIQSWAAAFQNDPELSGVTVVYKDLLAKGIEFPATDLDSLAPIHTPRKSVETAPPPPQQSPTQSPSLSPSTLTPEQRAKLQSELDVVQSNMNVMGEMLNEIRPGQEQPDELELLQELHVVCQSMQERIVDLIGKIQNDNLTEELLRVNDDLNNLFLRYGRWEKNRGAGTTQQSASAAVAKAIPPTNKKPLESNDSLIDFDDEEVPKQMEKMNIGAKGDVKLNGNNSKTGADEFDMFAQSRNVTYETSKNSGSTYKDNLEPDQVAGGLSSVVQAKNMTPEDREFDEMAKWLGKTAGGEESVTSSDFERFLAERAAAAESLPCATGSSSLPNASNSATSKKDEKNKKQADLLLS